ncbi:MAG: RluA family pseudouridine synthase, partial [Sandaracinaceae bacterium]|nr:RluA family pseudouridine synthase [Sandaracinaceae bacterium]
MNEPSTPQDFVVLFEDEHVLALDKPAGLPMHPTATYHKHTLTWLLKERYGVDAPQFAHRLDRETSGVVICGKSRR